MWDPSPEQEAIRDESALGLRILAPAGCGKTEALAIRIAGLLDRNVIAPPQRVLVLTFSNRARENARDRLRLHLPARMMRSAVTVSNLHGFAGRVVKAHGRVIDLSPELELPTSDWVSDECRARELSYRRADAAKRGLQAVKLEPLTDREVLEALSQAGNDDAIEIERSRQTEGVLTYDDLVRLAELILVKDRVAALYQKHFACLVVDEFQDLTPQQLRVIQRIGFQRTTYAGDVAQGIYSFAGANPEFVLAAICEETAVELPLTESYRSSPAVLAVVNALNGRTGGSELKCADPVSWPGGGLATGIAFNDVAQEAGWVVSFARRILESAPSQRVGVISRSASRRRFVDQAFAETQVVWRRWDDPLMDSATSAHMKKLVECVDVNQFHSGGVAYLIEEADLDVLDEPDTRKGVADAVGWMADLLSEGVQIAEITTRIKAAHSTKLLEAPGVHLLSGHVGKGQQFDWVVVVGLEAGSLPHFNARTDEEVREEARVFSVMLSRARHGVAVTRAVHVPTLAGEVQFKEPSPFLEELRNPRVLMAASDVDEWLSAAEWETLASR